MELSLDMLEDRQSRVVAAAEIVSFALERDLPHMALGAAREAARPALLALAAVPPRLSDPDLGLLRERAAASQPPSCSLALHFVSRIDFPDQPGTVMWAQRSCRAMYP